MDSFLPSVVPAHATQLDNTQATLAGLLTPPSLTEAQPAYLDQNIPHDQLVSKYKELQASNASLWTQVVNLQAQNNYWVRVYDYIEKGLAVKVQEMDALVQENKQLKVDPI